MGVEIPVESWPGSVRVATIGATSAEGGTRHYSVRVGGERTLPFLSFEAEMPYLPIVALEIKDRQPGDWSPLLADAWGEAMSAPGEWARAAEAALSSDPEPGLGPERPDGAHNDSSSRRPAFSIISAPAAESCLT